MRSSVISVYVLLLAACEANDRTESAVPVLKDGQTHCSGVLLAPTVVLTAAHCLAPRLTVLGIKVKEQHSNPTTTADLAYLVLEQSLPEPYATLTTAEPLLGDSVYTAAFGSGTTQHKELVIDRVWDFRVNLAGIICPGDSGSPLYDQTGELLAINTNGDCKDSAQAQRLDYYPEFMAEALQ